MQLKADTGEFTVPNLDLVSTGILNDIQKQLLPYDTSPIIAELYSLNIYENNGHFGKHKDTPRGPDMIGSLIICLPSIFMGVFTVEHHVSISCFNSSIQIDFELIISRLCYFIDQNVICNSFIHYYIGRSTTLRLGISDKEGERG